MVYRPILGRQIGVGKNDKPGLGLKDWGVRWPINN